MPDVQAWTSDPGPESPRDGLGWTARARTSLPFLEAHRAGRDRRPGRHGNVTRARVLTVVLRASAPEIDSRA